MDKGALSGSREPSRVTPSRPVGFDPARGRMDDYQVAVGRWMVECFGEVIAMDPLERIMRFLEEALELAQAEGMTSEEVARVVAYVFGRPTGETPQEVGGVMVTLAAFCYRRGVDLRAEALREFDRIDSPEMRRKIFAKQAFKRTQGLTSDSGFRAIAAGTRESGDAEQAPSEGCQSVIAQTPSESSNEQ